MKKLLFLITSIAFVSCDSNLTENMPQPEPQKEAIRTIEEAIDVATSAISTFNANDATRANEKSVDEKNIHYVIAKGKTRSSISQDTLLYIINYTDQNGFAIVSACRRGTALLGYVESGSYPCPETVDNTGFGEFLAAAENYVADNLEGPTTEEPQVDFTCYERSIVTQYGPYLTTSWGQTGVEGAYTSNGISGCSNTALAQIMCFFKYPSALALTFPDAPSDSEYFDWDDIALHRIRHSNTVCSASSNAHNSIGLLMRELGQRNFSEYVSNGTFTTITNVRNTCQDMGYIVSPVMDYDGENFERLLAARHLIYERGYHPLNGGHAWVVDGYMKVKYATYTYTDNGLEAERNIVTEEYNHINWGWNGVSNGYFNIGVYRTDQGRSNYDAPYFGEQASYNFTMSNMYFSIYHED